LGLHLYYGLGENMEMRRLKDQQQLADLHFDKHTKNIKLCCHIFFEYVNSKLRSIIPEYSTAKIHNRKQGILYCPKCLIKRLQEENEVR